VGYYRKKRHENFLLEQLWNAIAGITELDKHELSAILIEVLVSPVG